MAMLASGFEFQHGVSHKFLIVAIDIECTAVELRALDR